MCVCVASIMPKMCRIDYYLILKMAPFIMDPIKR